MDTRVSSIRKYNIELRYWNGSLSEISLRPLFVGQETRINWAQRCYFIRLNFIYRKF